MKDDCNVRTGDICRVKSGGPNMTVAQTTHVSVIPNFCRWWCTWFDGIQLRGAEFNDSVLIRVDEKK